MNAPRRGTPDFLLLFLTLALVAFGLLMVFSASSMISSFHKSGDSLYYAKRQAVFVVLGFLALAFFMNIPLAKLKKWTIPFFLGVLFLLLLVLLIGNGDAEFGARSWIDLKFFNLQPTEFAKLAVILYLSYLISKKGEKFRDVKKGLLPSLVILGLVSGLIMLQPDFGSCAILIGGAFLLILVGGGSVKHLGLISACGGVIAALFIFLPSVLHPGEPNYRLNRILTMFNPEHDPQGSGYQIIQSLFAFGHGGFTGTGLGKGIQKLHFLTQPYNDFIFAIIGEELGFFGSTLFLLVYALFIWRGIIVSLRCPDTYGSLVGVGIMSMLGLQALINLGGVTNTIPMTGVTLPLISYGGSSILVTMISMGIVLGISRGQSKAAAEARAKSFPRPVER